jgi:polyphosphate kinase 2
MGGLKRKDYEAQLEPLQHELVAMARWLQATGQRVAVLFEGRDTAGKGGVINAIADHMNPRQCRVVALPRPTERESSQWYFQRYVAHLPAAGEVVLFEKVMGFARDAQVKSFLKQAPAFEKLLVDDGILLFKYWLCCDQAEQEARFADRLKDPLKRWKLSPIDVEARRHYEDYTRAREAMLKATHTRHAPWTLVDFNDQKRGRLALIRDLLQRLPDTNVPPAKLAFEPLPAKPKKERFGVLKPIRG